MSKFNIVLIAPDIPGNCGSIGRTCVALDLRLILIRPYGFDLDEKSVRRAGLDYWKHVNLTEYNNWDEFLNSENPENDKLFFYSKTGNKVYYQAKYSKDCYLIFGSETKALPDHIFQDYPDQIYYLPQFSDQIRSLNLANCATAVGYECLRQLEF